MQNPTSTVTAIPPAGVRRGQSLMRLRASARELFVSQGYDRTRPQDIARLANVANGTFYLHFADKKQAFLDFAREAQNEFLAECDEHLAGLPRQARFAGFFDVVESFSKRYPGVLQAAFVDPVTIAPNDDAAWELYDRMGNYVETSLRRALPAAGDLALLSHALCGLLRHAMTYAHRKRIDRDAMVRELSHFIEGGLNNWSGGQPGRPVPDDN